MVTTVMKNDNNNRFTQRDRCGSLVLKINVEGAQFIHK